MLYEKVMVGKKTTYRPYTVPDTSMHLIESGQMVTLLATLTMSMLMSVEKQLPSHSKVTTEIKRTEDAISRLAKLTAKPLDDALVNIGVQAWNSAISSMQEGLTGRPS